jgi:outer membrane protein OmpA-like peptidoglycan-associated protein
MRRQISISVLLAALIASLTSGPANAVDTRTCAQGGTCAVGDVGPGGGVVFYARTSGDFSDSYTFTWQFRNIPQTNVVTVSLGSTDVSGLQFDYLESAPSSGIVTRPQASADGATGTSFSLGAGQANTNLFKQQFPSDTSLNNASLYADNYSNNGLGDWFLPSVDELALLSIRHLNNELGANDPFSQTNIFFWSSSAMENFLKDDSGLTKNYGMNSPATNSVIPIRAFSSTPAPVPTTTPTPTPTPTTSAAPVVTTPAKVSASSKIKFDRSSSVLTKASKAKLKKLAKTVGADAEIKVQAAVGPLNNASKAQMRALAKLRAKAIAKYLKSQISMNQTYKIKIIDEGIKPVTSVTAN